MIEHTTTQGRAGETLLDSWGPGALAIIGAAMAAYAAIVLSHLDYVPLWDGRIYADCVIDAASRPGWRALGCAGHIAQAYIAPLVLGSRLVPDSFTPIVVVNVLLGVIALAAFARLLGHLLPGRRWAVERALAVAALAVHPLFTVSTLQTNVDFGTLVFALPCLCALIERRVLAATVLGCLVVFTKETGFVVYGALAASVLFAVVMRRWVSWQESVVRLRPFVPLAVPVAIGFVALVDDVLGWRLLAQSSQDPLFGGSGLAIAGLVDAIDFSYFVGIFVLSFMWIPSVIVAADLALDGVRRWRGQTAAAYPGPEDETRAVLYGTILMALVLTRYKTYSNFRYFLTLYPLIIALCSVALARRLPSRLARAGLISAVVVLFAASNFRTFDPLSRAAFGTWPFGAHDLIDVTTTTDECCGHGRDQLVYNMEFTAISTLQDQALARIRPTADTVLAMDWDANWFTVGRVDPVTFRRTVRRSGTIEPRVLDSRALEKLSALPDELYYFAFANVENEAALAWLAGRYDTSAVWDFDDRGYTLRVHRMVRRSG